MEPPGGQKTEVEAHPERPGADPKFQEPERVQQAEFVSFGKAQRCSSCMFLFESSSHMQTRNGLSNFEDRRTPEKQSKHVD